MASSPFGEDAIFLGQWRPCNQQLQGVLFLEICADASAGFGSDE
jgi:hypothetical protein